MSKNGERVLENVQNTRLWVPPNNASWCAILDRWSLLTCLARGCESLDLDQTHRCHPAANPKVAELSLALAQH